jgi:NAD(P)-dependent dehydrogenase (short-subunit alcohol dehydrogenase family)
VRPFVCDLGDLDAVARAVRSFDEPVLHAVVCNAGVYGGSYSVTTNGFERTLGVCFVGHAALVLGLEEKLVRGAPSRVVMVSSDNRRWPRTFDWSDFPVSEKSYSELRAYGQAKLACVTFANALDARWKDRGVRGWSLHPGDLVRTAIDESSWVLRAAMWAARPFSPSIGEAAATSVHLATSPEVDGRGGAYFARMREVAPSPAALVAENQTRLWELVDRWVKEKQP